MLKFINKILNRKKKNQDIHFERCRCPKCNALLYEREKNTYEQGSVRIKCRMCKEIMVL